MIIFVCVCVVDLSSADVSFQSLTFHDIEHDSLWFFSVGLDNGDEEESNSLNSDKIFQIIDNHK